MGWSYTHLALFGPNQRQVAAELTDREAAISPTVNGFTLVADQSFESHERGQIAKLAVELSRKLSCPAITVFEFDDDVLCYQLIEAGQILDEYNSAPDYFDLAAKHARSRSPQGGDASRLCAALRCQEACQQVNVILHQLDLELPASERHKKLAGVLRMPTFSVGFDFNALQEGELPEGLAEFDVVFT
jgi:hypothetical protein